MKTRLIAPCGMNCAICSGYLREKNTCPGCRGMDESNPGYCRKCTIRHCEILKEKGMKYCSITCEKYPCKRLRALDRRYKTRYGMSMIENLEFIKKNGIRTFLKHEKQRWIRDNKIFCVHTKKYFEITALKKRT
jgi:hypothetical protein